MQLAIDDHISRLLFDHECVIIPGFGAFLTRYYSAEVNAATHMMRPPSRRLYFNRSIHENDGLLAKAISYTEGLTYKQSLAVIEDQVKEWVHLLKAGKKVAISGIGRLYVDENSRKLQFSPSLENNFLTSAYGLSIFRSPAVQREALIRKGVHKAIEKHMAKKPTTRKEAENAPATEKKKKRTPWAAVLVPIIFAGIVGAGYVAYQNDAFENVAGFNIFKSNDKPAEDIKAEELTSTEEPVEELNEEPAYEEENIITEEEVMSEEPASEDSFSAAEEVTAPSGYHIVVGSFHDRSNAEHYISELQAQGYDAYLANGTPDFSRVAIGNFQSWRQAKNALDGVRMNVNPGSWIYSN